MWWEVLMLYQPREEGQGLVEYALILVLVAVVVIVILALLGPVIGNVFSGIVQGLSVLPPIPLRRPPQAPGACVFQLS